MIFEQLLFGMFISKMQDVFRIYLVQLCMHYGVGLN
jgi:hypothetical protein